MCAEVDRLAEAKEQHVPWRKWGPYLSERQWDIIREDSHSGCNTQNGLTHDQTRSWAYTWGEDGIAGISDDKQTLCFAVALWNGHDPILKERLFGLTNSEGNHGKDVKEYYFYLDNTPTHSYMKYLYKYPQQVYPYADLINQNKKRNKNEFEYELLDTDTFKDDQYFDVYVEYAKKSPEDLLIQITAFNRSNQPAPLSILPTLWFRNSWGGHKTPTERPTLKKVEAMPNVAAVEAKHQVIGKCYLYCDGAPQLLFTENETNNQYLSGGTNPTAYLKDGINNYIINKDPATVNSTPVGTKTSAHYPLTIAAKQSQTVKLRLTHKKPEELPTIFGVEYDAAFNKRQNEADEFYASLSPKTLNKDEQNVLRQALSGMLWNKQYYAYDLAKCFRIHPGDHVPQSNRSIPDTSWFHMVNSDIISMPDKWEYPQYAAGPLAFHAVALSMVDPDYAKEQLNLMLTERYLNPSDQSQTDEQNLNNINPPIHTWAITFNHNLEEAMHGKADTTFLENAFQKLLKNFTWWINQKTNTANNMRHGNFLGLNKTRALDSNAQFTPGVTLDPADSTAWIAMFYQNMFTIASILAHSNPAYEDQAIKFFEYFLWTAHTLNNDSETQKIGPWDEQDGFYYDILHLPDGHSTRLKVRSMTGLISLCANTVFISDRMDKTPHSIDLMSKFIEHHPELIKNIPHPNVPGANGNFMLCLLTDDRLRRILYRMLDENEFLSPYGIRSLSKIHDKHPCQIHMDGKTVSINYEPAEATGIFDGNINWRGPVWFPTNILILRALLNLYAYYGNDFKIECPTGSGKMMTLFEVSKELANRLTRIFLKGHNGRRPVYGGTEKFQTNPDWKDNILFYEYFHGDNGAGLGASHQTGWTGLVAVLLKLYGSASSDVAHEKQGDAFKRLTGVL